MVVVSSSDEHGSSSWTVYLRTAGGQNIMREKGSRPGGSVLEETSLGSRGYAGRVRPRVDSITGGFHFHGGTHFISGLPLHTK